MAPFDVGKFGLFWGPGILVLVVFSYGLVKIAQHWISKAMEVKHREMDSIYQIARTYVEQSVEAQKAQADAFKRMASAVEKRDSEESFEHQEMLIAIKALHRHVEALAKGQGAGARS